MQAFTKSFLDLSDPEPATAAPELASERELFEAVYQRMRVLAGPTASDLPDLVQLAAEQVFKSIPSFEGKSSLTTWIYAVCYRVLLSQRRFYARWARRFQFDAELEDRVDDTPLVSSELEQRERAAQLWTHVARLSPKYRTVVLLHDLEGLAVSEIASIVDANERTVRSRLRDGRKRLARQLAADPNFDDGA